MRVCQGLPSRFPAFSRRSAKLENRANFATFRVICDFKFENSFH
jgi:hypothetical protein